MQHSYSLQTKIFQISRTTEGAISFSKPNYQSHQNYLPFSGTTLSNSFQRKLRLKSKAKKEEMEGEINT